MYTGSIPELVIRTGTIRPFNPQHARQDITERRVLDAVEIPTGHDVFVPPVAPAAAPALSGVYLGDDNQGRPVKEFPQAGNPTSEDARGAAAALQAAARLVRNTKVAAAVPSLVGGPISSLARGEAVILRWPNGVAIKAAL